MKNLKIQVTLDLPATDNGPYFVPIYDHVKEVVTKLLQKYPELERDDPWFKVYIGKGPERAEISWIFWYGGDLKAVQYTPVYEFESEFHPVASVKAMLDSLEPLVETILGSLKDKDKE